MDSKFGEVALTFDDVSLVPAYSEVVPSEVDTRTRLTRRIELNVPICSAAMDTVTDGNLAIAMARAGGIGIIHRNKGIEHQVSEIDKVKRSESGMITDPITLQPDATLRQAFDVMERYHIGGIPITEPDGKLVGMLTNRDVKYQTELDRSVSEVMTSENLTTAPLGTTLTQAKVALHQARREKLPIVDDDFRLRGLITIKDIDKITQFPHACKDENGRLRVGSAIGTATTPEDVQRLIDAGVDALVVDTAHGHSANVIEAARKLRKIYPELNLVAGNVVTAEATLALIEAGVDAVKVGVGPGSICTTRIVAGVGIPQLSAIYECAQVAERHGIPIIADGGIRYSGDVAKAIAAGASSVMVGSLLAGTDESPGEKVIFQGRSFKLYRAMGSLSAMSERASAGRERYFQSDQDDQEKLVPEGIEGRVPYKGKLGDLVYQLVGGLRSSMGYCGAPDIEAMRTKTRFVRVTNAGVRESHPHDIGITEEAPNYSPPDV